MKKNSIGYYYDIKPTININRFAELMIVVMAKNSLIIGLTPENYDIKTAVLPIDYKRSIGEILKVGEENHVLVFSKIINIEEYYDDQLKWEEKLGDSLKNTIDRLNKKFEYSFTEDTIKVEFKLDEIKSILSQYDESSIKDMVHFTNLISYFSNLRREKIEYQKMKRRQ